MPKEMKKIRGWVGISLVLLTIALCIWKGFLTGLIPVAILIAIEMVPVFEKNQHPFGKGKILSYLFTFHLAWYSFWLCVVFGTWSMFYHSSLVHAALGWSISSAWLRVIICVVLAVPVLAFQMLLSYWLPVISIRLVHIKSNSGQSFWFRCFGTWWGDGMKFLWLPDGKMIFASQNEFGWSRQVFDSTLPASRNSIWLVDAILIGIHPPIVEEPFELQYVSEKEAGLNDEKVAGQISRHFENRETDTFQAVKDFFCQAAPRRIGQALNGREVRSL